MNDPNVSNPYAGTPLGELMALDFMIDELNLYLDTHSDDTEAFSMLQSAIKLFEEGKEKYVYFLLFKFILLIMENNVILSETLKK